VLAELLDGGQAFRWNQKALGCWIGIWSSHVLELKQHPDSLQIHWRALTPQTTAEDVHDYFAFDLDFPQLTDELPWRSDPVLKTAIGRYPGLRILRQPLAETLIGFICSSAKRIPQIKQCLENLARAFGTPLTPEYHALPTWEQLASASENDLRACALGYRAKYIHQSAHFLADHPGFLEQISNLSDAQAHQHLLRLPGVGSKIADCVLLFGAHRLAAFPVDTWIAKSMRALYGLPHAKLADIAHFGHIHFGPAAGLAQQFIFSSAKTPAKPPPPNSQKP